MAVWTAEEKKEFRENHPLIAPERQPHHNSPHADLQVYFDSLLMADHCEYKGMVTVAARKAGDSTPKIVAVVPAAEMGNWASEMHVSTHMDYYYGRAQHCGNATWGESKAFAYNAIHVDIDAHGVNACDGKAVIDMICYALPDEGIPSPNIIEESGRGYHLVWLIDQVAAVLGWMVEAVSVSFAKVIQDLMATSGAKGYQVDIGYASNIAGLTRIPGTYNTAAGTYASYQMLHAVRMDLPKIYDSISSSTEQSHYAHTASHAASVTSIVDATSIGKKRVAALLRLNELRPIQISQRDVYCLHLYCAAQYAGMANQDALALVQSVNQSFDAPLSDREVERYMSSAAHKHYKFTTERMISDLDISPSEQESIGLHTGTGKRDSNRARNARVAAKRQKRDRAIMRLHLLGLAPTAIAKKVGHAYNTVRSVICKYKDNLWDIFSAHELRLLSKQAIHQFVEGCRKVREQTSFKNGSAIYYAYTPYVSPAVGEAGTSGSWTSRRPGVPEAESLFSMRS